MSDSGEMGLRALKKQMTREAIAEAALKLTIEKGLDHVTIDEIARQAFVSPRTFSNYFSCKEEAVIAADDHYTDDVVAALHRRPAGEPPLESLRHILVDLARSQSRQQLRAYVERVELEEQYPTLRPFRMAQYDHLEEELRNAVAQRTGTKVATDLYPWLVAAAAVSIVKTTTRLWAKPRSPRVRLIEKIEDAFDQVAAGLPGPAPANDAT
ncbi:TetR family transcriptional regulator [Georgenia soli]|uniref:TetR family transcriptional regulator n=1 Tax=Georgenia soli TaxID=638953 RepID=A0A2A9EH61_9MICO|nr:TetR/AcrR family transcriptional regulator [Georgenia soli]PFG38238.1 TetR family transcriptional regulator [Georgenia soli]